MPRVSVRAHKPRYKTEPLDLHQQPAGSDDGTVTKLRIVKVGVATVTAAHSGGTWQINGSVPPALPIEERPQVIYARPVEAPRAADPRAFDDWADHAPRRASARFGDTLAGEDSLPRPFLAELQMRAVRALSDLQSHMSTQGSMPGSWSKPSTRVMSLAVGVYALALFLFALLSR